jgi:cytochrome c oxidase cbb3-type subunit IV
MYRTFYAGMSWTDLPLFALLLFLCLFLAVCVRTWMFKKSEELDALAKLPFDEEVRR